MASTPVSNTMIVRYDILHGGFLQFHAVLAKREAHFCTHNAVNKREESRKKREH